MADEKTPTFNIGLSIVVGAVLWWALATGKLIAFSFSDLPDVFWVAVILVILLLLLKRR